MPLADQIPGPTLTHMIYLERAVLIGPIWKDHREGSPSVLPAAQNRVEITSKVVRDNACHQPSLADYGTVDLSLVRAHVRLRDLV